MGEHTNKLFHNIVGWTTTIILIGLTIALLVPLCKNWNHTTRDLSCTSLSHAGVDCTFREAPQSYSMEHYGDYCAPDTLVSRNLTLLKGFYSNDGENCYI